MSETPAVNVLEVFSVIAGVGYQMRVICIMKPTYWSPSSRSRQKKLYYDKDKVEEQTAVSGIRFLGASGTGWTPFKRER